VPISLGEFARILEDASKVAGGGYEEQAMTRACKLVRRKARGMIGTPQPFWPALKPETIARKAHGNTPLLETGEMRNSIEISEPQWEGPNTVVGYVYSNSPIARYQELGTPSIPPRPFLSTAAMGCEGQIHQIFASAMLEKQFKAFHIVKRALEFAWDEAKEMVDDDEKE
jgi:HK97 gp10 family phage protein